MIVQANQLFLQGKTQQAEHLYRQLLRKTPNNIDALWGLGKVALALDSYQASYDIFSRCVELAKHLPQLWLSLAQACEKLRRFLEAEQALISALQLNINYLPSLEAIAVFYCQSNQLDKANKYLDSIVKIVPEHPQAFALKVRIKSRVTMDSLATRLLEKLTSDSVAFSQQEQIVLHYAFAELYHLLGDVKQAYRHFQQANDKQRSSISFSVADMQDYFSSLLKVFLPELFTKHSSSTVDSPVILTPIFIVSQPRSGSTLLEQMLSAHSEISSAGELPFLAGDIAQGIFQLTGKDFPEGCQDLTPEQCQSLGQHYLTNMQTVAPNASYIIDKMPANYQSIGLIKMLLPHAKVIHISRDAKDVCWSIYRNYFAANEPYFCSFDEIVQYNKNYQEVISHWKTVLPTFVHHLSYETLVKNPKDELSRVLAFCELDFQSSCLDLNEQTGFIPTLSDVQLRSGLHANRGKAWQLYQALLPAYFTELE